MVTLESAENALKNVYLGVISNQLNVASNPLLAQIKHSTSNIYGKEIVKAAPIGINGGIGAGDEDGTLPEAGQTNYVQFKSGLKNLYGRLEITDKAIRATSNSVTSFVNLLNDEMEKLIEASNFNLGRMLYGDGSGVLGKCGGYNDVNWFMVVTEGIRNFIEGMKIDVYSSSGTLPSGSFPLRIKYVDRENSYIYTEETDYGSNEVSNGSLLCVQNSYGKEITGIEGIFSNSSLYGLSKNDYKWLNPYINSTASTLSDTLIQTAIDELEDMANSNINFISTTKAIRRLYQEYLGAYNRNIDVTELKGGFKTITYNGIPVVGDRFVPDNTMYLLNTDDFTMYELCDWKWLEDENGRVLKQMPNYPTYSATLVKYAELVCDKPSGQGKISDIASTLG